MKMKDMKENVVQFSTSDVINIDGSVTLTFNEITYGVKTKEKVTSLGTQNIDCFQDQEKKLDELMGQAPWQEQVKPRLEMTFVWMRKGAMTKAHMKDEELKEVRRNTQKKVNDLKVQINNEHKEKTLLLREKHELEGRLSEAAEPEHRDRVDDEVILQRLKRDLQKTKALLRDRHTQLDRKRAEA